MTVKESIYLSSAIHRLPSMAAGWAGAREWTVRGPDVSVVINGSISSPTF